MIGNILFLKSVNTLNHGAIKNEQSRDTWNIRHKTQSEDRLNKKHNTEY